MQQPGGTVIIFDVVEGGAVAEDALDDENNNDRQQHDHQIQTQLHQHHIFQLVGAVGEYSAEETGKSIGIDNVVQKLKGIGQGKYIGGSQEYQQKGRDHPAVQVALLDGVGHLPEHAAQSPEQKCRRQKE